MSTKPERLGDFGLMGNWPRFRLLVVIAVATPVLGFLPFFAVYAFWLENWIMRCAGLEPTKLPTLERVISEIIDVVQDRSAKQSAVSSIPNVGQVSDEALYEEFDWGRLRCFRLIWWLVLQQVVAACITLVAAGAVLVSQVTVLLGLAVSWSLGLLAAALIFWVLPSVFRMMSYQMIAAVLGPHDRTQKQERAFRLWNSNQSMGLAERLCELGLFLFAAVAIGLPILWGIGLGNVVPYLAALNESNAFIQIVVIVIGYGVLMALFQLVFGLAGAYFRHLVGRYMEQYPGLKDRGKGLDWWQGAFWPGFD